MTDDEDTTPRPHRRVVATGWQRALAEDDPLRQVYGALEATLRQTAGRGRREARLGVGCLYEFVQRFRKARGDPPDAPADPRILSGRQPDIDTAVEAWEAMRRDHGWGASYLRDVRTALARALRHHGGDELAYVINPRLYHGASGMRPDTQFHVTRSHRTTFTLHECLPWRVRGLPPRAGEYTLLTRIGEHMSHCLMSLSKQHLQSILVLFDHLLHDPPRLWNEAEGGTLEDHWRRLRELSPRDWLQRYAQGFQSEPARRIGFDLFKRQVRYLSLFYSRVLHPDSRLTIPLPSHHRRVLRRWEPLVTERHRDQQDDVRPDGYTSSSSSAVGDYGATSFGSSGGGLSDANEQALHERRELVTLLAEIRERCCHPPVEPMLAATRTFAFTPTEVRRMVEMACTTLEQLTLLLLLTTGLRIGGLARLQCPPGTPTPRTAAEVPPELYTTEKNNRVRTIRPTWCCRCLLARWYTHGRRTAPGHTMSAYVFPCPQGLTDRAVTPHFIWRICRGLFQRAGVHGAHVHPHTFRHTVVQMLFYTGASFEHIAKWIGHSTPQLTSAVYGRLSQREVEASLQGHVPFLQPPTHHGDSTQANNHDDTNVDEDPARAWAEVAVFLRAPYHFTEAPNDQPPPPTSSHHHHPPPTKQMKRDLLERARSGGHVTARVAESVNERLREQCALLQAVRDHLVGTSVAPSDDDAHSIRDAT